MVAVAVFEVEVAPARIAVEVAFRFAAVVAHID